MFDAVNQIVLAAPPHNPWVATFTPNVHYHYQILHTATDQRDPDHMPYREQDLFPQIPGFGEDLYYWLPDDNVSFHHNVGVDDATLEWTIMNARNKVPVKPASPWGP
jgi:hypothetical protein